MSKLADRLQNLSRSSVSPLGFHPSATESKSPAMLLIAGLSGAEVEEAEVVADANADAGLLLSQGLNLKVIKQMVKSAGDIPVGVLVKDVSEENVDKLGDSGCDFLVFDTKMPATTLHREGIGRFLMIGPSLDQGLVRAISSLDFDGVFLDFGEDSFITVEHLLVCQRFSELLDKPLIVILPCLVNSDVLSDLLQAGVGGVVTPAAQPGEALTELRKAIDNLPKEAKRRRTKASIVLPRYGESVSIEEDEDEEEEI